MKHKNHLTGSMVVLKWLYYVDNIMKIEAYREITDWSDSEYEVPNHTYLFDGKSNILAYAIAGTDEVVTFNKPMKVSTTRRKFEKVKHKALDKLTKTLQSKEKTLQSTNPQWQVKSDSGKVYTVELISGKYSCNCVGYGYRNSCRHSKEIAEMNLSMNV